MIKCDGREMLCFFIGVIFIIVGTFTYFGTRCFRLHEIYACWCKPLETIACKTTRQEFSQNLYFAHILLLCLIRIPLSTFSTLPCKFRFRLCNVQIFYHSLYIYAFYIMFMNKIENMLEGKE